MIASGEENRATSFVLIKIKLMESGIQSVTLETSGMVLLTRLLRLLKRAFSSAEGILSIEYRIGPHPPLGIWYFCWNNDGNDWSSISGTQHQPIDLRSIYIALGQLCDVCKLHPNRQRSGTRPDAGSWRPENLKG
jgi:hypothetical protein